RNRAIERAKERAAQRRTLPPDANAVKPRRIRQNTELAPSASEAPPFDPAPESAESEEDIPIRTLAYQPVIRKEPEPEPDPGPEFEEHISPESVAPKRKKMYKLPATELLHEVPSGSAYDGQELKEIASRIKSKLEEFNVRGSVTQINPGPVVTTFEYKPEAGIKYSRITTLTEDLCLGLQAESILIERLPGKPTVGIEVPNTRRELISLREILESDEFRDSPSRLTLALGKDINGRIKVAALESMPHLLIAGSTGSGKSVMLNAMIMSFLYKATPDEVRMIMIDPKRVELGIYEGIPHLLTPVITEPKKATNALRNAVLEMERRLKLLAAQGVRNIDQYNRKMAQVRAEPRGLFDDPEQDEALRPLPYVLILIDELADLMMLERANVEECITRLAQMARAVGMHLILATQRPSVDVITGLIKANFPSRISFRVATRVDSRTVLDSMGAEHLLGKGDMLFLPPGSSRLTRVHGAFCSEAEANRLVEFWKEQARPDYDQSFLLTPPSEEDGDEGAEALDGEQDALYEEAVRVVLEMGKASTSTLQRRLRLGYGRAARILDMMQREGIIGPPDGSKPRDVLKRPDWLREIEDQLR
ncbi:MAG: DNA translocase FtsK, partial [Bryobacteraceae bacterium]